MSTTIYVNFTPVTNRRVWFPDVASFNAFIGAINVTINDSDLPVADLSTRGVVYKASTISYTAPTVTPTWVTLNLDGVTPTNVPSEQAFNDLKDKVDGLAEYYSLLLTKLKNAGVMEA